MASALLWAVRTLQTVCPNAAIFLATPLQTYTPQEWMDESHGLLKRSVIQKVAQKRACTASTASMEAALTAALPALTAKSTRTRNGKSALLTL